MATSASSTPVAPPPRKEIPARLQRIVVGTDFSDASRDALRIAGELARAHGAELIVVSALDPMIATLEIAPEAIIDNAREGLEKIAGELKQPSLQVSTRLQIGKAWWVIDEAARETRADMVVVGSHGRTGMARLALGSTADRVVRSSRVPVLVIPAKHPPKTAAWRSALVGVDFSDESALAATLAARLLAASSAGDKTLMLFHCVALTIDMGPSLAPAFSPPTVGHWDRAEAKAREHLEQWAAPLRVDGVKVVTITFRGYAPDGLLQEARSRNADFIVVGTHGRGAINRMLLGSVAERVLHQADKPVLTIRHPDK